MTIHVIVIVDESLRAVDMIGTEDILMSAIEKGMIMIEVTAGIDRVEDSLVFQRHSCADL